MDKRLLLGFALLAVIIVGWYAFLRDRQLSDFPYAVKDGRVYCTDGTPRYDGTLVAEADAVTFRRPTQDGYNNAVAKGKRFMIDAVDKNNSFYQCSRVNLSGSI